MSVFDHELLKEIILGDDSPKADLLRYCLSDHTPITIDKVVDGDLSPIEYASKMMKYIEGSSFVVASDVKLTKQQKKHIGDIYLFDILLYLATLIRTTTLFGSDRQQIQTNLALGQIYALTIDDRTIEGSRTAGLTSYKDAVEWYQACNDDIKTNPDKELFFELVKHVGSIENNDWFLYRKNWVPLLSQSKKLIALNGFLHVAFLCASKIVSIEHIDSVLGINYNDVMAYIYEFNELMTDDSSSKQDVLLFVERLGYHFDGEIHSLKLSILTEAPFSMVNLFFNVCQADVDTFHQHIRKANLSYT